MWETFAGACYKFWLKLNVIEIKNVQFSVDFPRMHIWMLSKKFPLKCEIFQICATAPLF